MWAAFRASRLTSWEVCRSSFCKLGNFQREVPRQKSLGFSPALHRLYGFLALPMDRVSQDAETHTRTHTHSVMQQTWGPVVMQTTCPFL